MTQPEKNIEAALLQLAELKASTNTQIDAIVATLKTEPKPVYVPMPEPPVFASPNIVNLSGHHILTASGLGGKTEQQLKGTAQSLTLKGLGGTIDKPIKIVGPAEISGTLTNQRSIRTLDATKFVHLFNLIVRGNDGGIMLSTDANPAGLFLSDIEVHDPLFAGLWCNSNGVYQYIDTEFCRIFNTGGEGAYWGNTNSTTRSRIYRSHHRHLLVDGTGWDGFQTTSVDDLLLQSFTILNTGRKNETGQNALIQLQLCKGVVKNGILMGGTSSMNVASHDLLIQNCHVEWNNGDSIWVGEPTFGEPQLNGKDLVYDNDIFRCPGTKPLIATSMRSANIIVQNCIIPLERKVIFEDRRGTGATNKLIDGGGNQFVPFAEIPSPTFDNTASGKLVTSKYHLDRHMGYRTV